MQYNKSIQNQNMFKNKTIKEQVRLIAEEVSTHSRKSKKILDKEKNKFKFFGGEAKLF